MKRIAIDEPSRLDGFVKSFGASHSEDFKGLVLKLVESGQSLENVSALGGESLSTLYRLDERLEPKKEIGLENHQGQGGGSKARLTKEQKQQLKKTLDQKDWWSQGQVRNLVKAGME